MAETEPGQALRARAKVNLYLHILGRRSDGYHVLDSLIVFAELADRIEAAPADELSLTYDGPFAGILKQQLPALNDNLMLRAARALAEETGQKQGARLTLEKNIPPAAGLGGGSSDAAATLKALVRLWGAEIDATALAQLGLALGADVPACLVQPQSLFVGGIGEDIVPSPALPGCALLLVNPGIALETGRVFAALAVRDSEAARFEAPPKTATELADMMRDRRNDLEAPARSLAPEIDAVLAELNAVPGALLARMSGSGATCFVLFDDVAQARAGEAALKAEHPDWWAAATMVATGR